MKFNTESFEKEVLNGTGIAMVDFYADWCGPCKMLAPTIEEIASDRTDILVGKINVDETPDLAAKYGVMSIPTVIVFKDGVEVARSVGFKSKPELLGMLE
ncbi:MAG: thioredoxin [Lachnospiraceae bacterium]|nr:thioredoxin [Lachnospiraceae bacterium]